MTSFVLHFLTFLGIYIIVALSLNLLIGYTGIFSLAIGALFGVGAYTSALLNTALGLNFWVSLLGSIILTAIISAVVAAPALRVSGDYFMVASFGTQIILYNLFINWSSVTRGPSGVQGIQRPSLLGMTLTSTAQYTILTLVFAAVCAFLFWRIVNSPFGRILKGIREDEQAVLALGKDVVAYKLYSAVIAGMFAAVAGALFAHYVRYIDPYSFSLHESIFVLVLIILGGAGTIAGAVAGPFILLGFSEVLKFLSLPDAVAAPFRQILYGLLLILFMFVRPHGILGDPYLFQGHQKS